MHMDDYEKYAMGMMIVFGALIIGALISVHLVIYNKPGFLYALGAAIVAWFSAFAVLLDKPRLYSGLIIVSIGLIGASITTFVV
jgi:hypothetical protein